MKRLVLRMARGISVGRPAPIVKQAPLVLCYLAGVIIIVAVPGTAVTGAALAISGNSLIVVSTGLAVWFTWSKRFDHLLPLIPAIDIVALGAVRAGTGASISVFAVLTVLPVLWLASFEGRRFIVYTGLLSAFSLMLPLLVGMVTVDSTSDMVRAFYGPLVFVVIASIVNETSRQSRVQLRSIGRMVEDKERMLQQAIAAAEQLRDGEERLAEVADQFREVWEAVTEQAVISTDAKGAVQLWNPGAERLLGFTSQQTEGLRHVTDFMLDSELEERSRELKHPAGSAVLIPGFAGLVESARAEGAENREWTLRRADGSTVPAAVSVTRRTRLDGEPSGFLFVASDITQAREVNRLKDEFLGLISHELRTPLSSILGYLELLRDDEEAANLTDTQRKYLRVVERNARRLLRLVGDLLLTAQAESGGFRVESRAMQLEQVIEAAVETARPLADAAGVTLTVEHPGSPAIVEGDPVRLGQAIDNLLSNAVKFTPSGGRVTLGLALTATEAVVVITDTGLGIPENELSQLFGRFFRASTATRNAVPGVGLGLTITRAIAQAHGGRLEVESEVGVGTSFTLSLPLAPAAVPVE